MQPTQKLFRPVGKTEMELILQSNPTAFPPRLSWQPIFYPVLNFDYAAQIALEWNTKDEFSSYCGFVTAFEVDKTYLQKYGVQNVGAAMHNELWIPSEDLEAFNQHIKGNIQIEAVFYGDDYEGKVEGSKWLKDLDVREQLPVLSDKINDENIQQFVNDEFITILINYSYWIKKREYAILLRKISAKWNECFSSFELPNG